MTDRTSEQVATALRLTVDRDRYRRCYSLEAKLFDCDDAGYPVCSTTWCRPGWSRTRRTRPRTARKVEQPGEGVAEGCPADVGFGIKNR
jgi:hypothetical protein